MMSVAHTLSEVLVASVIRASGSSLIWVYSTLLIQVTMMMMMMMMMMMTMMVMMVMMMMSHVGGRHAGGGPPRLCHPVVGVQPHLGLLHALIQVQTGVMMMMMTMMMMIMMMSHVGGPHAGGGPRGLDRAGLGVEPHLGLLHPAHTGTDTRGGAG
jgi:hypothetical protein